MLAATETPRPHKRPAAARGASERDAADIAMHGSPPARARLIASALYGLLREPDDTKRVFVLGLAANRSAYPRLLARLTSDDQGFRLLRERPAIDSRSVDYERLRALPADTLGGAYARFLDERGLNPDLFQPPPGLPEVPGYLSQRLRQTHDIWHVLTGYDTDVGGEVALQAFTYAQLQAPSALLIAVGGVLRYAPFQPRIAGLALGGYRRGRRARFLPSTWFEEMWEQPLSEVRRELLLETPRPA